MKDELQIANILIIYLYRHNIIKVAKLDQPCDLTHETADVKIVLFNQLQSTERHKALQDIITMFVDR